MNASGRAMAPPRHLALRSLTWLPLLTLLVGLVVTAALTFVSDRDYHRNEQRLLRLRVRDASSLLTESVPAIQTPLVSAAALADATAANATRFRRFIAPYAGVSPGHQFVSVSLWRADDPQLRPVLVAGVAPELAPGSSQAINLLAAAAGSPTLHVVGLLREPDPRIGYAFATAGAQNGYVAYGEARLPTSRRSRFQGTSAFAGLDYAIYLGRERTPGNLLVTSVAHPPLEGQAEAVSVPFGTTTLTLVMSSRDSLAGPIPETLPWIIAVVGALLTAGSAIVAWRLIARRHEAETMARAMELVATENRRLYAEQRSIAQTLQHALLPTTLPQLDGTQTSGCYRAGERGVEIGGDWYDVIAVDDHRLLLVVGDVTGKGLRAATTMASLRFAIRAYAAQGDPPEIILTRLSELLSIKSSGQLATVLCALVDTERRELSVTSAGHLPPLLIADGDGSYVHSEVGLPVGVEAGARYLSTTIGMPPEATLLAFTDGLVEQRGESLEQGLARLSAAATQNGGELEGLLGRLVEDLPHGPSEDDIAMVGVRWTSKRADGERSDTLMNGIQMGT